MNDDLKPNLEQSLSYFSAATTQLAKGQQAKQDKIIMKACIEAGLEIEDILNNVRPITIEGDKFEHFYFNWGKPGEKRIISIERIPCVKYEDEKIKVEQRYY